MNKQEFLRRLESGLAGVAPDERVAAVQFYTEYFDDAGPESEQAVLAELGDPDKLAADIKAVSELVPEAPAADEAGAPVVLEAEQVTIVQDPFDMAEVPAAPDIPAAPEITASPTASPTVPAGGSEVGSTAAAAADEVPPQYRFPGGYVPPRYGMQATGQPYYGQQGQPYQNAAGTANGAPAQGYNGQPPYTQRPASGGVTNVFKVIFTIFLILLAPAVFGVAVAVFVILLVPFIISVAFLFSAVLVFVLSLLLIGAHIGSGLLLIGLSLLFLAAALALGWAGIKVFVKGLPAFFRGTTKLFRAIYGG